MSNVLVVDDSAFDRELVVRILSEEPSLTIETAEDGLKALARLKQGGIDLVVTDLQMPEVNGLQLVTTIRVDHPQVPVILMTAMGSEVIAMDALEQGASSYVPKRKLNEWMLGTVLDILSLTHSERAYQSLIGCFNSTQFSLSLTNDADLIDPLADYIQQIVAGMGLCDAAGGYQIGVALRQALNNALFHGNLEITNEQIEEDRERLLQGQPSLIEQRPGEAPYRDRRIHVDVQVSRDELRCTIRDEGPGFDVAALPATSNAETSEPTGGRGLVLMRTFMDEVAFNDSGNEVTLVKRRGS